MATNDFLPFAGGAGANVLTQAAYIAQSALRSNGFSAGTAQSAQLNKVWRQASIMSAVLAQLIADNTGSDVLDDGTTATILANLKKAIGGRLIGIQVFPATAVYTPTAGTSSVIALVQGAGGGGGGTPVITASQSAVGGPGNAGGFAASWITSGFSGVTVTVGAKGTSSVAGAGTNGGSSSFGAFLSAPGGKGGTAGAASSAYVIATAPQAPSQSTGGNIINTPEKIGTVGFSTGTNGGIKSLGGCCDLGSSQFNGDSVGYGAGGTSAANAGASGSLVAQAGWSGAPGVVIVLELS